MLTPHQGADSCETIELPTSTVAAGENLRFSTLPEKLTVVTIPGQK